MIITFKGSIPALTKEFFFEQLGIIQDAGLVMTAIYIGRRQLREIDSAVNQVKVIPDPTKPLDTAVDVPRRSTQFDVENPPGLLQVAGAPCYVLNVEDHLTFLGEE